jgi:hypothetical protein
MLPSVAAALGYWPEGAPEQPAARGGERVDDIANAAVRAAEVAGTEVSGTAINGAQRGPRGRWAVLLRRRRASVPEGVPGPQDQPGARLVEMPDDADTRVPARSPASRATVAGATAREDDADLPAR